MRTYSPKPRYRLNTRGKILLAVIAAVAAALVLLAIFYEEPPKDPAFLYDVAVPEWVDADYIDMDVNARKGALLEEVGGVVVHYVANPGTTAAQNRSYFNNAGTAVNSHFIIGLDGEVVQCVPLYEQSVASNDRNRDTISIEVCHPDESGKFTDASYNSLVRLAGWLSAVCGFKKDDIIRHYDVTEKLCPKYFVEHEDAWKQFKKEVMESKKAFLKEDS
ncbi:MAG: N-acetylmuramoyl-L-alanine amidase family protein [Christensenellaceae bacterium]|jgi:N-acetylmuramoyl-L-alanine amidase